MAGPAVAAGYGRFGGDAMDFIQRQFARQHHPFDAEPFQHLHDLRADALERLHFREQRVEDVRAHGGSLRPGVLPAPARQAPGHHQMIP